MFRMPFHSITSHFPEWFRIVALRSLSAECQERFFKYIIGLENSTKYQPEHIQVNAMTRLHMKRLEGDFGRSLKSQESAIARMWELFPKRNNTIITQSMIDEDPTGFAAHKERISDYLLDECWHEELEDGSWIFLDGEGEAEERSGNYVQLMHFR